MGEIIIVALFSAFPAVSVVAFDIECTACEGREFACFNQEPATVYNWQIQLGAATWVTPDGNNGPTGECDFPNPGGNVAGYVIRDQDFYKIKTFRYVTCDLGT